MRGWKEEGAVAGGSWHAGRRCFISTSLFNLLMHSLDPAKVVGAREKKEEKEKDGRLMRARHRAS